MNKLDLKQIIVEANDYATEHAKDSVKTHTEIFMSRYTEIIIDHAAKLIDSWPDSAEFETFGDRLNAYFKLNNK